MDVQCCPVASKVEAKLGITHRDPGYHGRLPVPDIECQYPKDVRGNIG